MPQLTAVSAVAPGIEIVPPLPLGKVGSHDASEDNELQQLTAEVATLARQVRQL